MLYVKLMVDGLHTGSLFIRNSGTEDKTGLNLRGVGDLEAPLAAIGEGVIRTLMVAMKDATKPMGVAERRLLAAVAADGAAPAALDGLHEDEYHHLLMEVGVKQGFLTAPSPGATPTDRGRWAITALEAI